MIFDRLLKKIWGTFFNKSFENQKPKYLKLRKKIKLKTSKKNLENIF